MVVLLIVVSAHAQTPSTARGLDPASLQELQAEIQKLRLESQELRGQVQILSEKLNLLLNATSGSDDKQEAEKRDRLTALTEEQDLLSAKITDQYQTKVESGSRYRVQLSGFVLVNVFGTRGSVDSLDLPTLARPQAPGDTTRKFAASARQSQLDLKLFGPEWRGAKATGDMSLDFWGGFPATSTGLSSGLVRLRTANLAIETAKTSIVAGQDTPFFSPRSPSSLASSAYPSMSSSGNIWSWIPQVHATHRFALAKHDTLLVQGGILDPFTGELPAEYERTPTAGERSGVPAVAARFGWTRQFDDDRQTEFGVGAYRSDQNWGFSRTVNSWALTADWDFPIAEGLSLSGELYRGRAIGGLGAGAAPSVLFQGSALTSASRVLALDNVGGWSQLKYKPANKIEFNATFGEDQPYRPGLRSLLSQRAIDGTSAGRNESGFLNVIYRARSNLLFSVEYRRLWTYGFYEPKQTADHFSVTSRIGF